MANNIGLDFGTTYSVISRLKNISRKADGSINEYELEACILNEGSSPCQDSVVVRERDGSFVCGPLTRDKTGRKGVIVYKGFKMMLAETNEEILKLRGYDEEFTPSRIVKEYLDDLLQKYIAISNQEEHIDRIVIGVPEVWFDEVLTIDCRTIVKDIVSSFPYVKEVEIVGEPAAACAFFVDNYRRNKNEAFNGNILLVDYGGGTLDIALCDVHEKNGHSEVTVKRSCGAGINKEDFIGKAGFAFIETVVKLALAPSGLTTEEMISHRHFYRCVNSVETALMNKMGDIEREFKRFKLMNRENMSKDFYTIEFDDEDYCVSYGMLAKAYNDIIYPVLNDKLDEIIDYAKSKSITIDKIVPVGGFCNFYLTIEQIEKKFNKGSDDTLFTDIINDRRDCEKAISYGAALIAENIISSKRLAPYSLGFGRGSKKELKKAYYVIAKGDEIIYDEPVFLKRDDGTEMLFAGEKIPLFLLNLSDSCDENGLLWGEPLEEYQDGLKLEPLVGNQRYKFGFSLDKSMIITLHKQKVDLSNPSEVQESSKVRLNNIYGILGSIIES